MKRLWRLKGRISVGFFAWLLVLAPLLSACNGSAQNIARTNTPKPAETEFTLQTTVDDEGLAFIGVGGDIDGLRNPALTVAEGESVVVNLIDGDGSLHTIGFPDFNVTSAEVNTKDEETSVTFTPDSAGTFSYICTIPGHAQAGMTGQLTVGDEAVASPQTADDIASPPDSVPAPIGDREPQTIDIPMEIVETEGQLDEGTTYDYWTFNGTVPGPMLRVREGDSVNLHLKNPADASMTHSIDLHAVNGPGGGATVMQVAPGEERMFSFQALNPGIYAYHCATPSVPLHITQGMYGMILVEPPGGLEPVDREYYVMQGDMYTSQPFGTKGNQEVDTEKMAAEQASYVVFNGQVGALTTNHPLTAEVGETVRIFFGSGGPNYTSSFHVIGEIFDRVYAEGSITTPPLTSVQTTTVAPGGATMVEFKVEVPGRYLLVDHALSRTEKGAAGYLIVEGPENPEVFFAPEGETPGGGH